MKSALTTHQSARNTPAIVLVLVAVMGLLGLPVGSLFLLAAWNRNEVNLGKFHFHAGHIDNDVLGRGLEFVRYRDASGNDYEISLGWW